MLQAKDAELPPQAFEKRKSPCLIVTDRENVDRRREDMGGGGPSPQDKER